MFLFLLFVYFEWVSGFQVLLLDVFGVTAAAELVCLVKESSSCLTY